MPLATALRSAASLMPMRSAASAASRRRSANGARAISSRTMVRISSRIAASRWGLASTRAIRASTTPVRASSSRAPSERRRSCGDVRRALDAGPPRDPIRPLDSTAGGDDEDCWKRMDAILEPQLFPATFANLGSLARSCSLHTTITPAVARVRAMCMRTSYFIPSPWTNSVRIQAACH